MADEKEDGEEDRPASRDAEAPGGDEPGRGRRGSDEPADSLRILSGFGLPPDALHLLSRSVRAAGDPGRPGGLPDLDPHRLYSRFDADLDDPGPALLLDHADLAVALEAGLFDLAPVVHPAVQAQGFVQVSLRDPMPAHLLRDDLSVVEQRAGAPLEDLAQGLGPEGGPGQQMVDPDQERRGRERHQEGARAVDGAAEHRSQHEPEDHVEGGLLAQEAVAADPQDGPAEEVDEDGPEAGLQSVHVLGLLPGAEEPLQSMPELIHSRPPIRPS